MRYFNKHYLTRTVDRVSITPNFWSRVVIFVDELLPSAFQIVETFFVGVDLSHQSFVLLKLVLKIPWKSRGTCSVTLKVKF